MTLAEKRAYYAHKRDHINAVRRAWYARNSKQINRRVVEWRRQRKAAA